MDLNEEERKVIAEMIQGAWASGSVRSRSMADLLDGILVKLKSEDGDKEDGESDK